MAVSDELVDDAAAQRSGAEGGEGLKGDDGRMGLALTEISLRVFFPCL